MPPLGPTFLRPEEYDSKAKRRCVCWGRCYGGSGVAGPRLRVFRGGLLPMFFLLLLSEVACDGIEVINPYTLNPDLTPTSSSGRRDDSRTRALTCRLFRIALFHAVTSDLFYLGTVQPRGSAIRNGEPAEVLLDMPVALTCRLCPMPLLSSCCTLVRCQAISC